MLPALIASAVVLLFGVYAESQNRVLYEQRLRAETLAKVNLIRAKLAGNITADMQVVRGLVAIIAAEPEIDQDRFATLAKKLVRGDTYLRNIAGAPDLVISLMYPMAGNEQAIGLDYRDVPAQREAALRARDTRDLVIAGPVQLKQGGTGLIGRFPVFVDGAGSGPYGSNGKFWASSRR